MSQKVNRPGAMLAIAVLFCCFGVWRPASLFPASRPGPAHTPLVRDIACAVRHFFLRLSRHERKSTTKLMRGKKCPRSDVFEIFEAYPRPPELPPPPGPPPLPPPRGGPPSPRALETFTRIGLPMKSLLSAREQAYAASSFVAKETNPKPRERPRGPERSRGASAVTVDGTQSRE